MLKNELEEELKICGNANNNLKEELRIAKATNNTTNQALHENKTEVRRLRKVLDRAITAVDCRISTIVYDVVPSMAGNSGLKPQHCEEETSTGIVGIELTEEQKFLNFVKVGILHDQYKPQDKDKFGSGFGERYFR